MTGRISRFEHIDKTKFYDSRHDYQLMLLGTRAVESGHSIGKLKGNEHPLFRGKSLASSIYFCASISPTLRARIIHDGSSKNRAVVKRDRPALPRKVT